MHLDHRTAVAIQCNPTSGSGSRRALLLDLVHTLRQRGLQPRIFRDRARLAERMQDARYRERLRCIVAAGGDGTVGDVLNRFPGVPLAILPCGTENLLARYLGIRASGREVAELIAKGSTRTIDVCQLGERRFAVVASAGFDAQVIHAAHAARKGHITRLAYVEPIVSGLRTYAHPEINVWLDDAPAPLQGCLVVLTNLPAYALGLPIAPGARDNDGLIDVHLFQQGSAFQLARYLYSIGTGQHEQLRDVVCARASRVRLESQTAVPLQVDGDPAGHTPAEIRVLPGALEVFAAKSP